MATREPVLAADDHPAAPGSAIFVFADDGGELWMEPGVTVHKVGDRGLPSPVMYRNDAIEGEPGYKFRFEIWDGVPVCTEVTVTAKPGERVDIRPMHIKKVARRLEDDLHRRLAVLAFKPVDDPGVQAKWVMERLVSAEASTEARKVVETARRTVRRKMTPELLQSVADTYRAAPGPGAEAVAAAFDVQTRQAWRYINKARAAGLLPEGDDT